MSDHPKTFDWPGWPLADNPYGKDFDLAARKRMLAGSQMLLPFIAKLSSIPRSLLRRQFGN